MGLHHHFDWLVCTSTSSSKLFSNAKSIGKMKEETFGSNRHGKATIAGNMHLGEFSELFENRSFLFNSEVTGINMINIIYWNCLWL